MTVLPPIVCAFALLAATADVRAAEPATQVTTYVPVVRAATRAGYCWTRSIAAPYRADAYRCMVGDTISDPCFAPKRAGVVVCGVNPATNGSGSALRLTKPLPREPVFTGAAQPWLVQLADRDICQPLTGTHEMLRGETILYECSESRTLMNAGSASGLIAGSFKPGRVWSVRRAVYRVRRGGEVVGTVTTVPIARLWR